MPRKPKPHGGRVAVVVRFPDNPDLWFDLLRLALENFARFAEPSAACKKYGSEDVRSQEDKMSWVTRMANDDSLFLKAIQTLREFSFTHRNKKFDGYSIHPVVHE